MGYKWAIVVFLTGPLWAETVQLTCDQQRYYEGETIQCHMQWEKPSSSVRDVRADWVILGKEVKTEIRMLPQNTNREMFAYQSPTGLKSVTPVQLAMSSITMKGYKNPSATIAQATVYLFPKNARFWVGEKEFASKRIQVRKSVAWVAKDLDALGIAYHMEESSTLGELRRFDVDISPDYISELKQNDPWFRWELIQRLRDSVHHG